ncbi:MAG: mechanosensitive ion channel family protein [bacterium]|nr:mechanosensitive ion channel family protein [Mycoplasmatota bacterium]MDD6757509.1 mechanosensitive ion channel family protein [bacterium]MDY2908885.1 mechanosensitive ion channel family protein [Candidatus Faecimonas sp.]
MKLFDSITIDLKEIIFPVVYIIIGFIIYKVLKRLVNKVMLNNKKMKKQHLQRANTIRIVILNVIKYSIVVLVLLAILANFGVNVKSIVAGLGITTAILGLAFQDLAKDLIAGISIITENQFEVGDIVEYDGFMGEVVFLGLKTTRIKDYRGAVKIIANHKLDTIINYSLNNYLAIVDLRISYNENPDKVSTALEEIKQELNGKVPNATGDIQIWGLDDFEDSNMRYRVVVETKSQEHYAAQRFLRSEFKKRLDKRNIKVTCQQIEVTHGK